MKRTSVLLAATLAASTVWGASAFAVEPLVKADDFPGDFSANVALASDYMWRGQSQTGYEPAVSGGFDYSYGLTDAVSLDLGTWASNINFDGGIEMDFYGGLSGSYKTIDWGTSFIYYFYPGPGDANFYEFSGSLGHDFGPLSVTGSVAYSPDFLASSSDGLYLKGGVDVPVGKYVTLTSWLGYQYFAGNANVDWYDYGIGASVNVLGFDVSATWNDAIAAGNTSCKSAYGDICGAFFVTVSRSF